MLRKAAEPYLKDAGIYRKRWWGQRVLYRECISEGHTMRLERVTDYCQ